MNCPCEQWQEVREFPSPGSYNHFLKWIASQVSAAVIQPIAPIEPDGFSEALTKRWYRCAHCGKVWILHPPDPPCAGSFAPYVPGVIR